MLEIAFVTPEGERLETNLKVKASDLETAGPVYGSDPEIILEYFRNILEIIFRNGLNK